MTIQKIIKNSIRQLQQNNEMLTPQNYERVFCQEAKKHGIIVEDCNRVDKFIKRLAPKYQKELYNRNIRTLDELFTFLTTILNRLDKEESAAVIKAYTLLIRRVIQTTSLHKDSELQKLVQSSLKVLDPHMKLSEIEQLRSSWNEYLLSYDDSHLQALKQYIPIDTMEYKQVCQELLNCLRDKPQTQFSFDLLAEVIKAALVPSVASQTNDQIAHVSKQLMQTPQSLTTQAMLDDIKAATKLRIKLDRSEIGQQLEKLNDIIERLSTKLQQLNGKSLQSNSEIKQIKVQLQEVDITKQDFEQLQGKLLHIVDSLDVETTEFYEDIKTKEEEVHNLKNRVQLLEKALQKEQKRSTTDALTKLPNKRASDTKIEELEAEFKRYGKVYSIVLFDIDKFKNINDTYGHDAGDIILSSIAKVFQNQKRDTDMFARLGGEEFAAILPFTTAQNAFTFAQKIRQSVQDSKFMYRGKRIEVTLSGGVSDRSEVGSVKELFKKADNLLYKAKNSGRNNIQQ